MGREEEGKAWEFSIPEANFLKWFKKGKYKLPSPSPLKMLLKGQVKRELRIDN